MSGSKSQVEAVELSPGLASLAERFQSGNRVALARAISVVENERPGFELLLHHLLAGGTPGGARLGITGPPGAGKSTLVTALARAYLEEGDTVGVVAVDPTSPYSGGALLGDRIRMNELATDPGIFIRSMASRGSLGGLATTTKEVLDVLDAFGFPRLLVETVGVGQTELEITGAADTVVVVLVPESGDGIQAMKAGLMEIADIFVVNKADRPGADRLVKEIRTAMNFRSSKLREGSGTLGSAGHHGPAGHHGSTGREGPTGHREPPRVARGGAEDRVSLGREDPAPTSEKATENGPEPWRPPVLLTTAHAGKGIDELKQAVEDHRSRLQASGELERRRRDRTAARIRDVMDRELKRRVRRALDDAGRLEEVLRRIEDGAATPYSAAGRVLEEMGIQRRAELL